jgi:hypothetical protein
LLLAATLVALLCKQRLPKKASNNLGCKPKLTALEACHRLALNEEQKEYKRKREKFSQKMEIN